MSRRRSHWTMMALCLAAFALRLGPLWANRFHPDEALYASWSLLIRTGRDVWLSHPPQAADKPPVLFYLMALSFHYLWRSEVAARLPGLIAGTLCVPLAFKMAGPVAAALVAFSPFAILFSPTAFLDPVMVMFALAACAAVARRRAGWAGLLLGLSAATKLTGLLFLPLVIGLPVKRHIRFWLGLAGVLGLVLAWDRLKGGTPFWVQQAINYDGLRLVAPAQVLPRLRVWLAFLPYFFGWPILGAILGLVIASLISRALHRARTSYALFPAPHYLLAFALFYLAIHWLLTFQMWDRYLLGLVPVLALLAGQLASPLLARLAHSTRFTFYVLFIALMLPPALLASRSGYPIGGDHGAYDGIEQVADYLRARPEGAVIYDHWLTWEFEYYLWDAQVYRAYFPTPDALRDDLREFGAATPRYVVVPAYASAQPVLDAIDQAGLDATAVLRTTNRRGQPTFSVYQITSRQ